tara:strand:- start:625 stop:873 length:249 start_codon:yes stop_codon:yes gene_type:complete
MQPKYKIGDIVKVHEYYSEMIVRNVYRGLIVKVTPFILGEPGSAPIYIYQILPDQDAVGVSPGKIQTAEEFAIDPVDVEEEW